MGRVVRIAALGDSLTAGHVSGGLWASYAPYTRMLEQRFGPAVRVENHGLDGDLTGSMKARLATDVLPARPDVVIIVGGANDLGWGMDESGILANLIAMIEQSLSTGAAVVVGAVPPISEFPSLRDKRKRLNKLLLSAANELGACYADLFGPLADHEGFLRPEYSSDGLHLTEEGYAAMGEVLGDAVEPLLNAPP